MLPFMYEKEYVNDDLEEILEDNELLRKAAYEDEEDR
jgi:hypothetical protein